MNRAVQLVPFEDSRAGALAPLDELRPAWEIRCGARTLREKLEDGFRRRACGGVARAALGEPAPDVDGAVLLVNGRVLCDAAFVRAAGALAPGEALVQRGTILALHATQSAARTLCADGFDDATWLDATRRRTSASARLLDAPWETIRHLDDELRRDLPHCAHGARRLRTSPILRIHGRNPATAGTGAQLDPYVVIDVTAGAVHIGRRARIGAFSVLTGPCVIGDDAVVKPHSLITGSAIGPTCRVAGEISSSIFHAFVNKQHEGFVGHSYLCPWVNLGAGTITSNLKNTYGNIRVERAGVKRDTGMQYLGTVCGDHTKTAINTALRTGSVIGVCCSVATDGPPPREIPSFTWLEGTHGEPFDVEKALALARTVMARRGVTFTATDEQRLRAAAASGRSS